MIVVSKYFTNWCKTDMDESLSDFQEPNRNLKSKHTEQKPVKPLKPRPKRKLKVKGQKDIRNILKPKKNDLMKYTEDFNSVCLQSGLDIDSEQLQIAVALSKSEQLGLEENATKSQESVSLKSLDSQERTKKIRTTLLEYGFKVPEIKINFNVIKKGRKLKKDSKLLKVTDEERQQKISVKYAEVLFNNFNYIKYKQETSSDIYPEIYSKATHTKYEALNNDGFFIIENLVEKSDTTIGSSLKDWSKIPGRPQSPCIELKKITFADLLLSESELDVLLSGTFTSVKKIISDKQYLPTAIETVVENKYKEMKSLDIDMKLKDSITSSSMSSEKRVDDSTPSATMQQRSCSPDIFEDESLCVVENTPMKSVHSKHVDIMDIANIKTFQYASESIDIFSLPCSQKSCYGLSVNNSKENLTKRISNDFMDLTECVKENILARIDVSHAKETMEMSHEVKHDNTLELASSIILTKYNTNQKIDDYREITKCVNLSLPIGNQNSSQTSNTKKMVNVMLAPAQIVNTEFVDLTENDKHTDDEGSSTIIYECESLMSHAYINLQAESDNDLKKSPRIIHSKEHKIEDHIDLTQESRSVSPDDDIGTNILDNLVYNHSDLNSHKESGIGDSDNELNKDNANGSCPTVFELEKKREHNHDNMCSLTGDKSPEVFCLSKSEPNFIKDKSAVYSSFSIEGSNSSSKSTDLGLNSQETNSNQSSQVVFEISDEELDYSINECKIEKIPTSDDEYEVCDDDNNVTRFNKSYKNGKEKVRKFSLNRSLSDSCLPVVEIKGIDIKTGLLSSRNTDKPKSLNSTPVKMSLKNVQSPKKYETPKNSEYIIKTTEVTPVLDYEKLSTPDRIKELDKYGLKPFKRKRAIQILKHLYNQTHPVMENLSDDNPSPTKRRKTNGSPLKNKSPNKQMNDYFPVKESTANKPEKENIFAVTNDTPVIKEVDCRPNDWVFQKREKAKIHTCKVPLHIAFHNYVSSRHALREAILQYQPVELDIIHKELAEYGHKYDPKDLLRFLDKKCITVKTTDNNIKNKRR